VTGSVLVRLFSLDDDDLGLTRLLPPVQIGDRVALEQGEFRVADVIEFQDAAIAALVKVEPIRHGITSA
jgi:hypothetical protein